MTRRLGGVSVRRESKEFGDADDMITTVTSKGQVTLPVEARRKLGLKPGSKLEVVVAGEDRLEIFPVAESVSTLKGMLPRPKKRLSLEDMDAAIARGAAS